jgi:hypothetical protein
VCLESVTLVCHNTDSKEVHAVFSLIPLYESIRLYLKHECDILNLGQIHLFKEEKGWVIIGQTYTSRLTRYVSKRCELRRVWVYGLLILCI